MRKTIATGSLVLVLLAFGASAAESPLLIDDFNDGLMLGWTPFLSGWSESDGVLHGTNTAADAPTEIEWSGGHAWTDYVAEVDVRILSSTFGSSAAGMLVRHKRSLVTPPIDYAQCVLYQDFAQRRIQTWAPGTSIVSEPVPFQIGEMYRLRATLVGNSVTCEVVGVAGTTVSVLISGPPFGTIALQAIGVPADFDNLRVTPILPADTAAPVIVSAVGTPDVIWPPNHKFVAVTISVAAVDDFDASPVSEVVDVTSDDATLAADDWAITGPMDVSLRAERPGDRARKYFVHVRTRDDAGNAAFTVVPIVVPHDRRR
jgi:hypothetical protein